MLFMAASNWFARKELEWLRDNARYLEVKGVGMAERFRQVSRG